MNMTQHRFSVKNMHVTCNIIPMFEEKKWKICEQSKIILEQHIRIQFQCNHTGSVGILFVFQFPFCAELRSNIEYERVKRKSNFTELLSANHL